jgi:hypothetical protein
VIEPSRRSAFEGGSSAEGWAARSGGVYPGGVLPAEGACDVAHALHGSWTLAADEQ